MHSSRKPLVRISSSTEVMNRPKNLKNSCWLGLRVTHLTEHMRTRVLMTATSRMNITDSRLSRKVILMLSLFMETYGNRARRTECLLVEWFTTVSSTTTVSVVEVTIAVILSRRFYWPS